MSSPLLSLLLCAWLSLFACQLQLCQAGPTEAFRAQVCATTAAIRATTKCGCVEAVGIDQVPACSSKSDACCKAGYALAYLPVTLSICDGCVPNSDGSAIPRDTPDASYESNAQALLEGLSTDPAEQVVSRDMEPQSSTRAVHIESTDGTAVPLPDNWHNFDEDDTTITNTQQTLLEATSRRQMRTQFASPPGWGNAGGVWSDGNLHLLRSAYRDVERMTLRQQIPRVVGDPNSEPWLPVDGGGAAIPRPAAVPAALQSDPSALIATKISFPADYALFPGLLPPAGIPDNSYPQPGVLTARLLYGWRALTNDQRQFIQKCAWWNLTPAQYAAPHPGGIPSGPYYWVPYTAALVQNMPPDVRLFLQDVAAAQPAPNANSIPFLSPQCQTYLLNINLANTQFGIILSPAVVGFGAPLSLADFNTLAWYEQWDRSYHAAFRALFYNMANPGPVAVGYQNKVAYHPELLYRLAITPDVERFDGVSQQGGDVFFIDNFYYVTDPHMVAGYRLTRAGGLLTATTIQQGFAPILRIRQFVQATYTNPGGMLRWGLPAGQPLINQLTVSQNVDQAGHVIGNQLGGRLDPLNFVPQGRSANDDVQGGVEDFIRGILTTCPAAILNYKLNFFYGNVASRRPAMVQYQVEYVSDTVAAQPCVWEGVPLPRGLILAARGLNVPD